MSKIYTLTAAEISDKVCELALTANMYLPEDVAESLKKARAAEKLERAQSLYDEIIQKRGTGRGEIYADMPRLRHGRAVH